MKKYFYILIIALLISIPLNIKALNVKEVDMDVYVDNNGTAHIREKWSYPKASSNSTEFYKSYDNLKDMKITNFSVTYNNSSFTYNENWDINDSFSEKSYKNGINYSGTKTELCWGITNLNSGIYTLTYDIEGFVKKLNDADMVYFNFMPPGNNIDNFHLKMYSDFSYSKELPVWGYGKKNGTAYVYDGYIEMNSESYIDEDEYITILVKYNKDTFSITSTIDKDFSYYQSLAKKGSKASIKSNPIYKFVTGIFSFIFSNIFPIIIFVSIVFAVKSAKNKIGTYKYNFEKGKRNLPKDVPNMRDVPFDNDIYKAYLYSTVYNLSKKKTDFLGAVLLKWLHENKISISKTESKILKKEISVIDLTREFTSSDTLESKLYEMMKEASRDGILESKEFEKWCNKNYDEILGWFDDVLDYETEKLIEENVLTKEKYKQVLVSDTFINDGIKLKGLKNFLEEFSRIDDKEAMEVKMWEYYLIYAQIFGIADKVAKQFKKLYPDYIKDYNDRYGYGLDDIIFINMISTSGMNSAISSRQKANSYSSGGGGFMSSGGGGGSFGGGGSMGSR